jgi:hypothetical protein
LVFVEVISGGRASASLEAAAPKGAVHLKLSAMGLDEVGPDVARVEHLQLFGKVRVEDQRFAFDDVNG